MTLRATSPSFLLSFLPSFLVGATLCGAPLAAQRARRAGDSATMILPVADSLRRLHLAELSPHLLVFTPDHRSATVTVHNAGNRPLEADLFVELGYAVWQNQDTVLFSPHWQREGPRDTVIDNPRPKDHYAGRWLSGLPTHVVLRPHQTQQLTLQLDPPKDLPNGEYYARVVSIVRPPNRTPPARPKDEKTVYRLPIRGIVAAPPLRDSIRVFYRQGPQTMGVTLTGAGAIDTTKEGNDSAQARAVGVNPFRNLVRVHLTGTAHFEGYQEVYYVTPSGGKIPLTADISEGGLGIVMHRDGVMRDLAQTDMLQPGHYTLVIRFIAQQDEFPPSQRISMEPAQIVLPFDIP